MSFTHRRTEGSSCLFEKRRTRGLARPFGSWLLAAILLSTSACSIRRFAVNKIGDALASGGSTYAEDEDLELVAAALPFGLKLIEGLLAESPKHKALLVTACEGFTMYSYVYVHEQASRAAEEDLERARRAQCFTERRSRRDRQRPRILLRR